MSQEQDFHISNYGPLYTGIYEVPAPGQPVPFEDDEFWDWLNDLQSLILRHVDGPYSSKREIPEHVKNQPHAGGYVNIDLWDGNGPAIIVPKPYMHLHSELPEVRGAALKEFLDFNVEEQLSVILALDAIEFFQVSNFAEHHLTDKNRRDPLFGAMFDLGRLYERMHVRPYEPEIALARWRSARSRHNFDGVNAIHAEKRSKFQPMVDELMARGLKYTPACAEVAAQLDVDERTVRNNTVNPRPQKRGRLPK